MDMVLFATFLNFALITSFTPGPNNLIAMASGTAFGWRRTVPQMLGIASGVSSMVLLAALGLEEVIDRWPVILQIVRILGGLWLMWLAWQFVRAALFSGKSGQGGITQLGKPLTFLQAAAFQWVNPKAWTMALTAITVYAADRSVLAILLVAAMFAAVCVPCLSVWTLLGQEMRRFLTNPARLRAFNWTMAALLVASLLPVVYH